jgi:hypothetical protein
MNGYQRRAPFYRSEFAVRDDFPLLRLLLTGSESLVVDIPSGAGRLLPVHQAHGRDVAAHEPAQAWLCGIAGQVAPGTQASRDAALAQPLKQRKLTV